MNNKPNTVTNHFVPFVVAILGTLLFYFAQHKLIGRWYYDADYVSYVFYSTIVLSSAFFWVRYQSFTNIYSIMTRGTAVGLLLYLLVEPPEFTFANSNAEGLFNFVVYGYWVAVFLAAVSTVRPAFLAPVAFYTLGVRYTVAPISGFHLSVLDIRYITEMAIFLSIGLICLSVFRYAETRKPSLTTRYINLNQLEACMAFVAIGFHFGNYFWSGYAKLFIGPEIWTWALENNTENMLLVSLYKGVNPLGQWPVVTQYVFDYFSRVSSITNIFVLLTQLFAIVAVFRIAWIKYSSYAYDLLHIGIYVVGGLFFWPWIWNNLTILWAVRKENDSAIGLAPKLCCLVVILLGFYRPLGNFALLAWFDTTEAQLVKFQVQEKGTLDWVDVPVSFFLSHSYAVSHGYHGSAVLEGHFEPSIWGSIQSYERYSSSGECQETKTDLKYETAEEFEDRKRRVEAFIKAHHRKMLELSSGTGWPNFYLRSHHHPSNPLLHTDFSQLEPSSVAKYRLLTESVCLHLVGGKLSKDTVKQDWIYIDVEE